MAFTEDLTPFFSTGDFAVDATLDGVSVVGIFDRAYLDPLGNAVEGTGPVFTLPTTSAADVAHGANLVIGSDTYKVRGVEPDGTGVSLLRLELQ